MDLHTKVTVGKNNVLYYFRSGLPAVTPAIKNEGKISYKSLLPLSTTKSAYQARKSKFTSTLQSPPNPVPKITFKFSCN